MIAPALSGPPTLTFVVPGSIAQRTGGYLYDARIVDELRRAGWTVSVCELDGRFPAPSDADLEQAAERLRSIPTGSTVVVDGLAFGAMPEQVEAERERLQLIALVHHPLAAESGLDAASVERLYATERRALACARRVIVTSPTTASALATYGVGANAITVAEPGTEPAPLARGGGGDALSLLAVGTLIPRKGYDVLFTALSELRAHAWHLRCVGDDGRDPETAQRLRTQLSALGLAQRVTFAGEADQAMLDRHYNGADLFVLPTRYEGYGMAVAEALARGLPVISTPTGGIAEMVGGDAGILVPADDVNALASALEEVMASPARLAQLTHGARSRRNRLATWQQAAARFISGLAVQP